MDWLTRADIDTVLESLSADDLIESMSGDATGMQQGLSVVKGAFNGAAERAGYGELATKRVRASDFKYLADQIGEVINIDSPLSEGTEDLLASAVTGG